MKRLWPYFFAPLFFGIFAAACDRTNFCLIGCDGGQTNTGPSALPSPSPSPSASATATPADPCKPVIGVNLSGPTLVPIGEVFKVDVTPVSPAGPLEGPILDACNVGRIVTIDSLSPNLRCVGQCSGFGPQFAAQGVGPFSVTIRVEGASSTFAGTVTR